MNTEISVSHLDIYDTKILQHLENDGRMAFSLIAQEIGISNTMVHQRVTKLTEQGILKVLNLYWMKKSAMTGHHLPD